MVWEVVAGMITHIDGYDDTKLVDKKDPPPTNCRNCGAPIVLIDFGRRYKPCSYCKTENIK